MSGKTAPTISAEVQGEYIEDHVGLERLIFFSDAVFAIAITLLALDIRLPASEGKMTDVELFHALLSIGPKYLSYVISFMVIAMYWMGHHRKFRFIRRYNNRLILLNMVFLMSVAFIPFPTAILSEYGNRTATIFYALTMAVTGFFSWLVWWYASDHNRLLDVTFKPPERWYSLRALMVSLVFVLSIGIALFNADLARLSWLFVVVVSMRMR